MSAALRVEFWKSRRRWYWLLGAALLAVELLWILWSFNSPSEQDLETGWMGLLYNMPLLNGILFPVIGAALASRVADVEHKGNTLKLLETLQPKARLLNAKLILGVFQLLPLAVVQVIVLLGAGRFYGFYGAPVLMDYALYALFTFSACFAVYELQLVLSLLLRNQMVPLCIGLGGAFVALLLMFLPFDLARLLCGPYGFFGALSFVRMEDWNKETRIFHLVRVQTPWVSFAVLLCWMAAIYLAGHAVLRRKEL